VPGLIFFFRASRVEREKERGRVEDSVCERDRENSVIDKLWGCIFFLVLFDVSDF